MENGEKKSPDTLKDLANAYQFFLRHVENTCRGDMRLALVYIQELEKVRTELVPYTEKLSKPVAQSVALHLLRQWDETVPMLIRLYVTWKTVQLQSHRVLYPEHVEQWVQEENDTALLRNRYLTQK